MKKTIFLILLISTFCFGQKEQIDSIIDKEYELGHFNGSILIAKNGKVITKLNKGFANLQFKVPINNNTKFPIASTTKLFTAILILKLQEKGELQFNDKITKYIDSLPKRFGDITVSDLLLHKSGLANEPIKAYLSKYKIDDFIKNFVKKKQSLDTIDFNYNNVDYVLLSRIIEKITNENFSKAIENLILKPLKLTNTGFVNESEVINNLAYGYHNYTFGSGKPEDKIYNDRRFISNYFGAGQIYSTTQDLHILIKALSNDQLISRKTRIKYLTTKQNEIYIDWLQGYSTYGFFLDNKTYSFPVIRRGGNIDGFNSEIIMDKEFNRILIILCNTDTADLKEISNKIFCISVNIPN
ncbi:CubicO group peptidase (beta-lactamase class C family) [Gillisia sp. Hel_I_86]|uniref:serine hydrolase domain-containing protein n=1 Tax=Gillisia sp. Hel_I_86 TaxID=1249981 RepID=UPI00119C1EDE|nr:serine hydrolase domain-containing protein [Gillisia sp. Hel_I_86]TVZ26519.1 CubicO group peptidase (beta-lactamase class C family) [Gillisia sp. Hel_I_86]